VIRPWRLVAFVVVVAAVAALAANRTWVAAQARAVAVLAVVLDVPGLTHAVGLVTDEPREQDRPVAGVPTLVVRPGGDGPHTAVVFVNGVTRRGRRHPTVRRLVRGFARTGHLVYVPDPPGLASGELTPRTLAAVVAVARAAARSPDARGGHVAFVGVSAGGSLALLAAADDELCARVSVVAGVAPYTDLVDMVRLATTGFHVERGRLVRYEAEPFVSLVTARSLAAGLPPGRDRALLLGALRAVPDDSQAPLAALRRRRPPGLREGGRALAALLANRDPRRFDALFARLPAPVRAATQGLSPILRASRLCAAVELISAPHDKYFPPAESRAVVRAAPDARLTISQTLQHADLELSLGQLADLARLDAYLVRVLHDARR
jgi:pimeloyl-ACP methyl ester carboxylesterase